MQTIELKMTPISEGLPTRDELRGEQTILTYCEQVGTWDLAFYEAGWGEIDRGFVLGVSHWLDITGMWPGVTAQVTEFQKDDLKLLEQHNREQGREIDRLKSEIAATKLALFKARTALQALLDFPGGMYAPALERKAREALGEAQ